MAGSKLPFVFARDQQVVIAGGQVLLGPQATQTGMREAQRRLGADLTDVLTLDEAGFAEALSRAYDAAEEPAEDGVVFELEEAQSSARQRDLMEDSGDAPVIQLVNRLLRKAVQNGASDLHFEPHEQGLRVRMRVDGYLQEIMNRADVPVRRIVSRLKVMSGLDIAETRLPQDGRIPLAMGGRMIDTRVSSLPGHYGERIVLRILDRSTGLMPLPALGLSSAQQRVLQRLASMPNGIILATGPTGAGKTTTLYSLLLLANRDERNIVTIEDPIEYDLPGVSQSQINSEIGMTFAAGLRATLRQDPDVILVGEIRDPETGQVAAQSALTGHLVFSSLHANSSVGAVVRLRDLGLDNFLISAMLRGVIAQRLLRKLCSNCKRPHTPSNEEAARFTRHGLPVPERLFEPGSCEACGGSGHAGRVGIFEILEVDDTLRGAIDRGATETELRAQALAAGETLVGQGLSMTASGSVSLTETLRVVGDVA